MIRIKMRQNGVFIGYLIETVIINNTREYVIQNGTNRFFIKADLVSQIH